MPRHSANHRSPTSLASPQPGTLTSQNSKPCSAASAFDAGPEAARHRVADEHDAWRSVGFRCGRHVCSGCRRLAGGGATSSDAETSSTTDGTPPVVVKSTATMSTAAVAGAPTRICQPRSDPRRMGCSTKTYDAAAAAKVTARRSASSEEPSRPVRLALSHT